MALEPGTRLGSFEISRTLGVGGMGEVYLATDTNLGREVAIKVLPQSLAHDPERLARFQREAKLLAALDHPNICAVHDMQEIDGTRFIVMQYIKGTTLADRIATGPIPIDEALPLFAQIAEALEAAHEQGIIHRDLKPGNIIITEDAKAKVLDFGLGKAIEYEAGNASGSAPTKAATPDSTKMSQEGIVLGTPVYMSPEQARGKAVDKRTDIWAFGCCLYEALTGDLPFQGETVSDTLAKVLERDPDWELLPKDTPWRVRELLETCLEKDARYRLRDIGDAWSALRRLITESGRVKAVAHEDAASSTRSTVLGASIVFGATIIAAALFFALRAQIPTTEPSSRVLSEADRRMSSSPVRRYSILSESPIVTAFGMVALSPNGRKVAYAVSDGETRRLVVRDMGDFTERELEGTDGAGGPFFSPDGEWLGFFTQPEGKLKKISIRGGVPIVLSEAGSPLPLGGSWGDDGYIVFCPGLGSGLMRISADGGTPQPLTDLKRPGRQDVVHMMPHVLPGSRAVLFTTSFSPDPSGWQIAAFRYDTEEYSILVETGTFPVYARSGHLLYTHAGQVMAVPFDLDTVKTVGAAVAVTEDRMNTPQSITPRLLAISDEGTLAYVPVSQDVEVDSVLYWVDRSGQAERLPLTLPHFYLPRISPDGNQIVGSDFALKDLWLHDLARGTSSRFTAHQGTLNADAIWSPDGSEIVFVSNRSGSIQLYRKRLDGSSAQQLFDQDVELAASSWTLDGRTLLVHNWLRSGPSALGLIVLTENPPTYRSLLESDGYVWAPAVSPNGKWLAYVSDEAGHDDIYVRSFPDMERSWTVTTEGGTTPVWAADGKRLFYHRGQSIFEVAVETETTFRAGVPRELFSESYYLTSMGRNFDVSPDGERFLMMRRGGMVDSTPTNEVRIVENWFEVLRRLAPVEGKP